MESMDWNKWLERYRLQVGLLLAGLALVGFGLLLIRFFQSESPQIEIISDQKAGTIWVDLEGAVEKPGIYELPDSARLNDLLIKAGGLSAEADRDWIARNLNLADKLTDGEKVYLPTQKEISQFGGPGLTTSGQVAGTSATEVSRININTASPSQLDGLWGIGTARAKNIIDNRPYQKTEDLVSRTIIPQNIYDRIKNQISVY